MSTHHGAPGHTDQGIQYRAFGVYAPRRHVLQYKFSFQIPGWGLLYLSTWRQPLITDQY